MQRNLQAMYYASYLLKKTNRMPIYLIHFVTERCPADCHHCFLKRSQDDPGDPEMTLAEIERFTRRLKRLLFVFLTGGEPFLREDLAGIARAYHQNAGVLKIQCPTNGAYPDRAVQFAREVSRSCPGLHMSITVSFDAVGQRHDESRRFPGLFQRACETFHRLREEEERLPNFNVNATTTVSRFNQDGLETLHEFVRNELKCSNYFNTLVRGTPRDPGVLEVDIDRFDAMNRTLDHALRSAGMAGYRRFPFADFVNAKNLISRSLISDTARTGEFATPCYAGTIAGVIYSAGAVYPCELRSDCMGYLRQNDYNLETIWRSASAQAIRGRIHRERCRCTHECFTTLNILFNPVFLPRLVWETARMKSRRMIRRLIPD